MATNHTEKYELNQWLPTDPVIRTDFNEDNAKIEAALWAISQRILSADLISEAFDLHNQRITSLETRVTAIEQQLGSGYGE